MAECLQKNSTTTELIGFSPPASNRCSTVYLSGNLLEVVTTTGSHDNLSIYKKMSKNFYVDESTGELLQYHPREHSPDNLSYCKKSFEELRRIIWTNFTGSCSELHVTLTVAPEHDGNLSSLYPAFQVFWKRLHYRYSGCNYLAIAEPHESGRYHLHLLLLATGNTSLFIPNEEIAQLWGLGFTSSRRTMDAERQAEYFCSMKKRQRWSEFYQPNRHLYRCSKGVARPTIFKVARGEVDSYVKQEHFRRVSGYVYKVRQMDGAGRERIVNTVTREQFRR